MNFQVPKEVCSKQQLPPRKIKKPVNKKWCYTPEPEIYWTSLTLKYVKSEAQIKCHQMLIEEKNVFQYLKCDYFLFGLFAFKRKETN